MSSAPLYLTSFDALEVTQHVLGVSVVSGGGVCHVASKAAYSLGNGRHRVDGQVHELANEHGVCTHGVGIRLGRQRKS